MTILKNALQQSHEYIKKAVVSGDILVDATCGNGHDTVFLAGLAGPNGKVYAFDIQKEALFRTQQQLKELNIPAECVLIEDSHANMESYVKEKIKACMFNLGYLPGSDKSISTEPATTIKAITESMKLLLPGGIITVVVYHGKNSGPAEKDALLDFIEKIDQNFFLTVVILYKNQKNEPPFLILIEKL